MCGIVCFYGRSHGVRRVLDALELLAYRAPDSSGLAVVDQKGHLAVRRCVGDSKALQERLEADPLPPIRPGPIQVVVGHGRWAMVGAVTEANAHPITDRSQERLVVENGSHNATLMLQTMAEQETWWQARGVPDDEPIHRTENTTEVLAQEWERLVLQLAAGQPPPGSEDFLDRLDEWGIDNPEERAVRLAAWRLREGNAHACAFYGRRQPETLYITSQDKPIAIACRTHADGRQEVMVASDVNAALMLWPKPEVDAAAARINSLQATLHHQGATSPPPGGTEGGTTQAQLDALLNHFTVDVIFLDNELNQGRELFARLSPGQNGRPQIAVSLYDGTPTAAAPRPFCLNPAMVGKGGYPSYTENHIAEIPQVLADNIRVHVPDGQVNLASVWHDDQLFAPGLNLARLRSNFGPGLARLRRLLLIGEGSSWRDAQCAAPLFRQLLPDTLVNVYRPVRLLNLGESLDPAHDLAVEISWSGTTDSLLKVDGWLAELGLLRLAVTGRPQSDLGRRTAGDGGTLDAQTGVEVSVATVKGFTGLLMVLDLLAVQLAAEKGDPVGLPGDLSTVTNELILAVPHYVRAVVEDDARRARIRQLAGRCRRYNKVAVVGNSPIDVEAELKVEELAQVLAASFDFHAASLRALIERSALAADEVARTLFIINATGPDAVREARPVIHYLRELGVFCLVHTTDRVQAAVWASFPNVEVFTSPQVAETLQPLIDAPFFFDLAVALAYARGLSPAEIDRPRNLAKSVTTTGAERRTDVEARQEFHNLTLAQFNEQRLARAAWNAERGGPTRAALAATVALRGALALIGEPPPPQLALNGTGHLVVVADTEATESGAAMAAAAWEDLLGADLTVYRRFVGDPLQAPAADTNLLRLIRAGAVLDARDDGTVALPSDLSPLQLELLAAVYLSGLAVRLARDRGLETAAWQTGLAQLPLVAAETLADESLAMTVQATLAPLVGAGYDRVQVIGGGQDYAGATSIARSLRMRGFLAEALYTDSAWHGPLAAVGGPGPEHDTLVVILATDPLFQSAALVDTQVYRTRHAPVLLVVPRGNEELPAVRGVAATKVLPVPTVPRPFTPIVSAVLGEVLARQMAQIWEETRLE